MVAPNRRAATRAAATDMPSLSTCYAEPARDVRALVFGSYWRKAVLLIEGHEPGQSEGRYTVTKADSIKVSNVTGIAETNGKSVPAHSRAKLSTSLG